MCTTALIKTPIRMIDTQRDLAAIVPVGKHVRYADYPDEAFEPDSCLCPINIKATLEAAGYEVVSGWEQPKGYTDYEAWIPDYERKRDLARYEEAMAETRAASVDTGPKGEGPEEGLSSSGSAVAAKAARRPDTSPLLQQKGPNNG